MLLRRLRPPPALVRVPVRAPVTTANLVSPDAAKPAVAALAVHSAPAMSAIAPLVRFPVMPSATVSQHEPAVPVQPASQAQSAPARPPFGIGTVIQAPRPSAAFSFPGLR